MDTRIDVTVHRDVNLPRVNPENCIGYLEAYFDYSFEQTN